MPRAESAYQQSAREAGVLPPPANVLDLPEDEYLAWLRTQSLGGSEVGAILGLSDWDTPADIYDRKLGLARHSLDDGDNTHQARGRALEPIAAELYQAETGRALVPSGGHQRPWEHAPYMHASPDRLILPCASGFDGNGVLEIKVPRSRNFQRARTEGISSAYYAQIQYYMTLLGYGWGSFVLFNADEWELHWFDLERDPDFCDRMVAEVARFWSEHLERRMRPGRARSAPVVVAPARVGAEGVYSDDAALVAAVARLRSAHEEAGLAERVLDQAKDAVRALVGEHDLVVGPGFRISNKAGTRTSLDEDALRADHPDWDLRPYRRQRATARSLRVTYQ